MRKLAIFAVTALVLAVAAVAYAVTNTYTVTGSVNPKKAGSIKKPVPVSVKFDYTVGEATGQRPSPVKKYSIKFDGINANTEPFAKCSAESITNAQSNKGCPAASVVGRGSVKAVVGGSNNPQEQSLKCNLELTVHNSGKNKAALFLEGGPNESDPKRQCITPQAVAISAGFVRSASGTALEFTVPDNLLHAPGLDIAVTNVQSSIKLLTKKVKGRKVGFFESVGGCKGGKRNITVAFTSENNQTTRRQDQSACKK